MTALILPRSCAPAPGRAAFAINFATGFAAHLAGTLALTLALLTLLTTPARAAELGKTIRAVKPAVVGVGTQQPTRSPAIAFVATGFVVGDGLSVITNAHGIPESLATEQLEKLGILVPRGDSLEFREARLVGIDLVHDLAHLRLTGAPLPALTLGETVGIEEGQSLAFTGFPLEMVLGLHHATHRATLAAITPVVLPSRSSRKLEPRTISQLAKGPYMVYQLDATAYPGNSGSPVYDPDNGKVLGVITSVVVKGLKESAITRPSGVAYAIPVSHVRALLKQAAP